MGRLSVFTILSDIVPCDKMAKKEVTTKSFVLRVDAATMDAVEAWAADEFRSTNGQLQWIIAEALRKSGRLKKPKNQPKTLEDHENI